MAKTYRSSHHASLHPSTPPHLSPEHEGLQDLMQAVDHHYTLLHRQPVGLSVAALQSV
jgi:hypothetical protein